MSEGEREYIWLLRKIRRKTGRHYCNQSSINLEIEEEEEDKEEKRSELEEKKKRKDIGHK